MYELPRETAEYIYPEVTVAGEVVTDNVQFCVVPLTERPETWIDAVEVDGKTAILIENLPPGMYRVFSRVNGNPPQVPVEDDIYFVIT